LLKDTQSNYPIKMDELQDLFED